MSTGGCPQVVAKKVELLRKFYNIIVVEYEMLAWSYVVQRNRVINMIGNKFISLSENSMLGSSIVKSGKNKGTPVTVASQTFKAGSGPHKGTAGVFKLG